jgi:hypothetical protein
MCFLFQVVVEVVGSMEVAHPAELVYADEIVVSLQVVLLEASSD